MILSENVPLEDYNKQQQMKFHHLFKELCWCFYTMTNIEIAYGVNKVNQDFKKKLMNIKIKFYKKAKSETIYNNTEENKIRTFLEETEATQIN